MGEKYIEHNGSGYVDTTVDAVIKKERMEKKIDIEKCNFNKMLKDIKNILRKYNYVLDGPMSLVNVDSGTKKRIY